MQEPNVKSPCIEKCVLSELSVCVGCGRTGDEIAGWMSASEECRRAIVAAAAQRVAEAGQSSVTTSLSEKPRRQA
ncbi:DUF1289 domain-containing protein [Rubripirellula amarantea]|uniref:DUF1289 domain-containing protein n=1 Tax=Rubripirellula amarantea TaxID=2527999 RepID=UPI0011B4950E